MLDKIEQIKELIDQAKSVLVVTRKNPTEDSIGSLLATGLVLEKMNKEIDLVCPAGFSSALSFLPKFDRIEKNLKSADHFVISLDTSAAKVTEFSYDFDKDGNRLNIFITPEKGKYSEENVSTFAGSYNYQLIVTVNTPDLDSLGEIYEQHSSLFFKTPIINIDNSPANENFGEVNLVDIKASSTAEVLYQTIKQIDPNFIDENVATCLLAGIIAGTQSFQNAKTTPKSFQAAAALIDKGADQQMIIKKIYKTKSLATLKLWGRVLARLKHEYDSRFVWSLVGKEDFAKAGASEIDLVGILDEITLSVPEAKIIAVVFEHSPKVIHGFLRIVPPLPANGLGDELTILEKTEHEWKVQFGEKTLTEVENKLNELTKNLFGTK